MEPATIDCQGCYYTISSFICLTEDLSQILQFLWRHGCLRRSYSCTRCGKKCAIGDKDLFFRCNRVTGVAENQPDVNLAQDILPVVSHSQSQQHNGSNMHIELHPMQTLLDVKAYHDGLSLFIHPSLGQSIGLSGDPNHPALRHNTSLPGDPLPPNHPSLVYSVTTDSMTQCGNRDSNVYLVQVDDSTTHNPELEDLDAQSKKKKELKSTFIGNPNAKKRCNFKVSMKKGTIFEKSKLPIDTVCKFIVFWCCMKHPTQEFLHNELSLATRTVVYWSMVCREICVNWAKRHSEKIGGDGIIVQVDEVKMAGGKQDENGHRFSFWGIEKDKDQGRLFIAPVSSCDSWTLLNVVNDWVLPGSIIVSSCWKSYDCLNRTEFVQHSVAHGKTLLHPPTAQSQSNIEGQTEVVDGQIKRKFEDFQIPRFGTRRSHHLGDLAEFMFKRRYSNHLERMHAFFCQVSLAYPLR